MNSWSVALGLSGGNRRGDREAAVGLLVYYTICQRDTYLTGPQSGMCKLDTQQVGYHLMKCR